MQHSPGWPSVPDRPRMSYEAEPQSTDQHLLNLAVDIWYAHTGSHHEPEPDQVQEIYEWLASGDDSGDLPPLEQLVEDWAQHVEE